MIDILSYLMENDVQIVGKNNNVLTADEAFELGGEFVVLNKDGTEELYRGDDFEKANQILQS